MAKKTFIAGGLQVPVACSANMYNSWGLLKPLECSSQKIATSNCMYWSHSICTENDASLQKLALSTSVFIESAKTFYNKYIYSVLHSEQIEGETPYILTFSIQILYLHSTA